MRNMVFCIASVLAFLLLGTDVYAVIVIDEFDAPPSPGQNLAFQRNADTSVPINNTSSTADTTGGDTIGGNRDLFIDPGSGIGRVTSSANNFGDGLFRFQSDSTISGRFEIQYDAMADATFSDVDTDGLGGQDITELGVNDGLFFNSLSLSTNGSGPLMLVLKAFAATDGRMSTLTLAVNAVPITTVYAAFSDFSDPTVFSELGALVVSNQAQRTGITLSVDSITAGAAVPEPSTYALFTIGVLGLLGCSLYRYRKATVVGTMT